jgi:hypothetical protein
MARPPSEPLLLRTSRTHAAEWMEREGGGNLSTLVLVVVAILCFSCSMMTVMVVMAARTLRPSPPSVSLLPDLSLSFIKCAEQRAYTHTHTQIHVHRSMMILARRRCVCVCTYMKVPSLPPPPSPRVVFSAGALTAFVCNDLHCTAGCECGCASSRNPYFLLLTPPGPSPLSPLRTDAYGVQSDRSSSMQSQPGFDSLPPPSLLKPSLHPFVHTYQHQRHTHQLHIIIVRACPATLPCLPLSFPSYPRRRVAFHRVYHHCCYCRLPCGWC